MESVIKHKGTSQEPSCHESKDSRFGAHSTIGASQSHVLVSAREVGALEAQCTAEHALDVVGDFVRVFPGRAGELQRDLVEECDLVERGGVHHEEEGVHALPAGGGGAVEHGHAVVHGDREDLVGELGEEGGEAEQEGLPAGSALGADDEVALLQELAHHGGVVLAVARERNRLDGREELAEAGDRVRDGRHGPAERDRHQHGVQERAVRADEEHAELVVLRVRRRGRSALHSQAHAEDDERVVHPAHGQEGSGRHAKNRQEEPYR